MKKILLVSLVVICAAILVIIIVWLNSASMKPEISNPGGFNLIFKYGVGAKNILNTFDQTYTKDMIMDLPITVKFTLSEDEKAAIFQKINELKIFDIKQPVKGNVQVSPCSSYYLMVETASGEKDMSWSSCDGQIDEKLQQFTEYIIKIIESNQEYQQLPVPQGGYI